jgi:polyferredoxin
MLRRVLRPRVYIYGGLLLTVALTFVSSIALRSPLRVDVIRDRGVMARLKNDGAVENVYRLHLMNATETPQRYQVDVIGPAGLALVSPLFVELGPVQEQTVPVAVQLPSASATPLTGQTLQIQFAISQRLSHGQDIRVLESTTFHLPRL